MIFSSVCLRVIAPLLNFYSYIQLDWDQMFIIEAILADNLLDQNIQTRSVIISKIYNRKKLSSIISFLNENIPLNQHSLTHLKRVHSKSEHCHVIVIPAIENVNNCNENDVIEKSLHEFGDNLKVFLDQNDMNNLKITNVPSKLPLTRPQFERSSLLWPVNFHEDKYISKCLTGTLFSDEQLKTIFSLMNETLDLTVNATEQSHSCSKHSCKSMAAIIVKNERNLKVTSALSNTISSPLNHAVMIAIDNVANIHRNSKAKNSQEELMHYENDYLCTNYECFLSQDPCIMCAMALVHSRIKRVFIYSDPNRQECSECNDQAFQTHKLHILDNLNHHYEVWKLSPVNLDNQEPLPSKRIKL